MTIKFIDLSTQKKILGNSIQNAIAKVLTHENYIFGPEVQTVEQKLAKFWKTKNAIACSNGTDAIRLALLNENIKANDTVITPAFTYIATIEAPKLMGIQTFLCDVCPVNYIITPKTLKQAITNAKKLKLKPKAVISVDLFGMPVNYPEIKKICKENNLKLISDSAQSFGSFLNKKSAPHYADYASVSFFPAKVLGCYGDGGGLFYNDTKKDKKLRTIAFHGHGQNDKHLYIGDNIRMGTIQAAILIEKLSIFAAELKARRKIAKKYHKAFAQLCGVPEIASSVEPVWAQYSITTNKRNALQNYLTEQDIPTRIYYKRAAHQQTPYKDCPHGDMTHTEFLQKSILSLPIHPYLPDEQVDYIIHHVTKFLS